MSEEQKDENPEITKSEVIKPESGNVEVSGDMLNEALVQLKRLSELRQKEVERQERAIAQMSSAIKRQSMLNRLVLFTSLVVVVVVFGLAYMIKELSRDQDQTVGALEDVGSRLTVTADTIAREAERQSGAIDSVREEIILTRDEQVQMAQKVESEMQSTRQVQNQMIQKVEGQINVVRNERDVIKNEVRSVLDTKTSEIADREVALAEQRKDLETQKVKTLEVRQKILADAIERLNEMSATLGQSTPADYEGLDGSDTTPGEPVDVVPTEAEQEPAEGGEVQPAPESGSSEPAEGAFETTNDEEAPVAPDASEASSAEQP